MKENLENAAREIVRRLQEAGHEAYWVGGCVRDRLLGLEPKDYDVATSARPPEAAALFPRSDMVGARFGVLLVIEGGHPFEVATFRRDGRYVDHRRPTEVSFGTLEQDARRRDFTINAMYHDPIADRLLDPHGGREDLEQRVLRCVGEAAERFEEDALRLLRAVRFAARFDLRMAPETETALKETAAQIDSISAERVREELVRMMTGPRRGEALRRLSEFGLLARILPEVEAMKGVEQPPEFHPEGDVFTHTCLALDALEETPSPTLAIATLLHDVGKPPTFRVAPDRVRFDEHADRGAEMADAICRRLKFPNAQRERIVHIVAGHMRFMNVQNMRKAKLKRLLADPAFGEELALHRADCLASHGDLGNVEFCEAKRAEFLREAATIVPPPLIGGDDLIAAGYEPGPRFGEILSAVGDTQMEGDVTTKDEAMRWVRRNFPMNERAGEVPQLLLDKE